MTLICDYFSPTTPTAATFTEDLTGAIRLGSLTGLVGEAELGAVGIGSQAFDDEDSTLGNAADGIVGLKQMYFTETACPAGNQRLWTGYIGDRSYARGDAEPSGTPSSLILGAARKIGTTLLDVNSFLNFRVFAPTAEDPTSDFVRPAETDIERITALLTTVDFLSTTLFDIGYVNPAGPVAMDLNDYTGSRPIDVLADCAAASGKNFFPMYDETTNQLVLWYDWWYSDGTTTVPFDSTIRLTNVDSERNATTLAINPGAVCTLDPSRVVSAAWGPYDGGTAYRTLPSTANTFAWRDAVVPLQTVKTAAKANAILDRYLLENSTEDPRISLTVQIPNSQVTLVREGMRIELHATHMPLVAADFTWCRILQRTIRQDQETPDFYWLDLELSPLPGLVCTTQVSVIAIYDSGTSAPDTVPFSATIPASSVRPSAVLGFWIGKLDGTDIGYPQTVTGPWTFIDGYAPSIGGRHINMGVASLDLPSGSPAALEVDWGGHFSLDVTWRMMGFSISTSATAPVNTGSQLLSGSTVTMSGAPTPGNIWVALLVGEDAGNAPVDTGPMTDAGWQVVAEGTMQPVSTEHGSMAVLVKCIDAADTSTVTVSGDSFSHWAFVQEWAFS